MSGSLETFAIIGRPNVGKSSLFNYLISARKSVVKNQPGVTRDLLFEDADIWGRNYQIVDTGGLTEAEDIISQKIREQVVEFLKTVDGLILVMDVKAGLCPEDREIVRLAKETHLPFLIVANKADKAQELDIVGADFYEFGENVVTCSVERRLGMEPILQWIYDHSHAHEVDTSYGFPIAIVGKPNVGKSSMCNQLIGEDRMLVSEIAGTTIDPVDTLISYNERRYLFIDTAGLRRSARRTDGLEILSAFKTDRSIKRAEVVLLMVDGTEGPTEQDARITQQIIEANKTPILVINKLDLGEQDIPEFRKTTRAKIKDVFHFYKDIPITFVSAKTGKGLKDLFELIEATRQKLHIRISTSDLNDFFTKVIRKAPAPIWGTRNVKFYYLTQTQQTPPSFIAFANHPDGVNRTYRRFLTNQIKEHWELAGIPVRIFVMKSRSS